MEGDPRQIVREKTFSYRPFQASDLKGILKLWEENSGWGGITEQQYYDWYIDTPYGPCLTVLALNEKEEVVGQQVYMPRAMTIGDVKHKALRAVAPILAEEARIAHMLSPAHPLTSMFKCAVQYAAAQGCALIYTLPAYGWSAWMKAFYRFGLPAWNIATYPCFKIELHENTSTGNVKDDDLQLIEVSKMSPDFDHRKWAVSMSETPGIGFCRTSKWINWKFAQDRIYCIRAAEVLVAYFILKKDSNLLLDFQVVSGLSFAQIFSFAVASLKINALAGETLGPDFITGMLTPFWEQVLQVQDYSLVDYSFVYGMYNLSDALEPSFFQPEQWKLFPGD